MMDPTFGALQDAPAQGSALGASALAGAKSVAQGSAHRIGARPAELINTNSKDNESIDAAAIDAAIRSALRCYDRQSRFVRWFVRGRELLCPMRAIARHVPLSGRVLDVGCGHGLFVNILAATSSARQIVGCDPSDHKIAVATESSSSFPHVSYLLGIAQEIDEPASFDAVSILDVLYLLPDDLATQLLWHCRRLLKDDGLFLLKTNDRRPLWKFAMVWLEETLMVKVIGFTFGSQIHFRSREQYEKLLEEAGFRVEQMQKLDGWRPVPHRLFVCRPR